MLTNYTKRLLVQLGLLLAILSSCFPAIGGDSIPIGRLNIDRGLSNNSVRCIFQDHNGFMWFGTYDGLNRYDGHDFKVFRNVLEDTNSLPHNFIYVITEDSSCNLWIGTGQGIAIYDMVTGKFHLASYQQQNNSPQYRITSHVGSMAVDKAGNVYVGTNGMGLMVATKGSRTATQVPLLEHGSWTNDYNVTSIQLDRTGKVWLFIARLGLYQYNEKTQQIVPVNTTLTDASVIQFDKKDNLWIGATADLYQYQPATRSLQLKYAGQSSNRQPNRIASLLVDKEDNIWVGTHGGGAMIFDREGLPLKQLQAGDSPYELSGEVVSAVYEDRDGRKWIGTLNGGIDIYNPEQQFFHTISHTRFGKNDLVSNFASCFLEHSDGTIWVGTDGGGLSIWDRKTGRFSNYKNNARNAGSLTNNHVSSIIQDYQGDVWIATFGGGISKWDRITKTFTPYKCRNEVAGMENDNVWIMFEDTNKVLWATTFGNGMLYYLNREKDRFEMFSQHLVDLLSIYQDKDGVLWAGTAHDLIRIDRADKKHVRYEIGKPVRAILEDRAGNMWIGAEGGGLILFDRQSGKLVKRFTVKDGLSNNGVLNILEDGNGNLWMSTFNGLSQFNPATNIFRTYYQDDGLQSNQFLYGAALKFHSGEMLFGGIRGFNIFNPAFIPVAKNNPAVLITDMQINNQPLSQAGAYIKQTWQGKITTIQMPFNDASLSVDFAALEYGKPNKISYAFFLEGWDKDWNYVGNTRQANYTKLHEGNYVLHIRATNTEGNWSSNEMTLQIKVLPPWYRSWWAYSLYVILFIWAVVFYQRYRINQAKLKYDVALAKANASKEKAEREKAEAEYKIHLAETEMEKIRVEKEQEVNDKRLSFFTNITHEFRTPISLIINPVKELLQGSDIHKKDQGALKVVYRNARRLLSLVDQLLLFRKAEAGADRLRIVKLDLPVLCKEVFLAFEHQAQTSNIQYTCKTPPGPVEIYSDREKLEIVFLNLLSNAFKYTPAGGSITMELTCNTDTVTLSVKDTGYGIPAHVGEQLFERFYQVQQNTPAKPGFGIGLYLVKHFINSLKGTVWYESGEGTGTVFYIQLGKGCQHIDEELIESSATPSTGIFEELIDAEYAPEMPAKDANRLSELDALVSEKKSILLVDDDKQTVAYLSGLFADNFIVFTADNATDGLKLAGKQIPDIIISDINMEGVSGIEFCINIKEDPHLSHIPVILLTGNSAQQTRLEGLEGGADDYITKPFDKDLLMARVQNILKSRTSLQKYFYNTITFGKTAYKVAPEYQQFLDNCIRIVEVHLDNPDFGIKMLATELHMGQSNLYKKIKSICGQPPTAFIRFIRLRKAAKLLMETDNNITQAAFESGFNDLKYFREQFTKLFGLRPSDYVKTYRRGRGKHPAAEDNDDI
ncbi:MULTISPECIES: hybrid sensor histidine kinase/response regulator transcription factor [Niastella]|uniref:histidine kinase n=1 Tax=Niastella soli TaxID=2821487 RepID=A0ABS3Z140_9BACT|nr:hybrid sensor histidine kinase/response regulator transcription factor [Niastella soli]MBO9203868.1 response regulator [Niastella soli]